MLHAREGERSVMTPQQVLLAVESVRRAQTDGRYAPHKPLLLLLALARAQQGESRLMTLGEVEPKLKELLRTFAPSSSVKTRHYPYWHLQSDAGRQLWQVEGPRSLIDRSPGATPNLGELKQPGVQAGFTPEVSRALMDQPGLLREAALRVLDAYFPETLHQDIAAAAGVDLEPPHQVQEPETPYLTQTLRRRKRDPEFRERVLRAYEWRCCVCGFDLRVGHMPAGLEAAHIQWHHMGGPDEEPNGLSLCALHHKLFDLGAFTIEPVSHRIEFSQHAVAGVRGDAGELRHHGRPMLQPQHQDMNPAPIYLEWNRRNVFKAPVRA
jgi:putative restriction endonuclease